MDLSDGVPCASARMVIRAGDYDASVKMQI